MCDTDYERHGGSDAPIVFAIAGAFFLGLLALIKAAWWLAVHLAAPLIAGLSIAAWRWTTGAPMLPDRHTTTAPMFTRGVRAVGRNLLTLLTCGALIAPVVTAVATVTVVAAGIATVIAVRMRTARHARPRRVRATVGPGWRAPNMRRRVTQYAITDQRSDLTWTEQSVRDAAGRAA